MRGVLSLAAFPIAMVIVLIIASFIKSAKEYLKKGSLDKEG